MASRQGACGSPRGPITRGTFAAASGVRWRAREAIHTSYPDVGVPVALNSCEISGPIYPRFVLQEGGQGVGMRTTASQRDPLIELLGDEALASAVEVAAPAARLRSRQQPVPAGRQRQATAAVEPL